MKEIDTPLEGASALSLTATYDEYDNIDLMNTLLDTWFNLTSWKHTIPGLSSL